MYAGITNNSSNTIIKCHHCENNINDHQPCEMTSSETRDCDVTAKKCVALQRGNTVYKRCMANGVLRCDRVIHETCKVKEKTFLFLYFLALRMSLSEPAQRF